MFIDEVVITVKKKLIEKKSDRLIYNVQNSVFSNGVSGDELLKNIPRIDPTSDGLKIIGKSNVLVMIDDRIMNISGEDLRNYLKTLLLLVYNLARFLLLENVKLTCSIGLSCPIDTRIPRNFSTSCGDKPSPIDSAPTGE